MPITHPTVKVPGNTLAAVADWNANHSGSVVPTFVVAASNSLNPTQADYQCDGAADEVQINAALTALPAGGGCVFLMEGTYSIDAPIALSTKDSLIGTGKGTEISPTGNFDVISCGGTGILIKNLYVNGVGGGAGTDGIVFGCDHSTIEGCWIENCGRHGILPEGAGANYNIIRGNVCNSNGSNGVDLGGGDYNVVIGNEFNSNGTSGVYMDSDAHDNTITGNIIEANTGAAGIQLQSADNNVISNNTIRSNTNEGILLAAGAFNNIIIGNMIHANRNGIVLGPTGGIHDNIIDGNMIYANTRHGILVSISYGNVSNNTVITGNLIQDNDVNNTSTYDGIHIAKGNNTVISSNRCRDNDRYEINIMIGTNNLIIGNHCEGTDHVGTINDAGTGTMLIGNDEGDGFKFGDTTNYTNIDRDGKIVFVGSAGLPFGSCSGYHINWVQAAAQNTWYNVSDADFINGLLNNVTHDGNGKLTVLKAGIYKVDVNLDLETNAANVHVEIGFEVNASGAAQTEGILCNETKFADEEHQEGTTALLDLAANATVELCVRTTDAGNPNIKVDCVSFNLVQVGGT